MRYIKIEIIKQQMYTYNLPHINFIFFVISHSAEVTTTQKVFNDANTIRKQNDQNDI